MVEEAIGWNGLLQGGKMLLIKDCVASPGSFLLHYLINRLLTSSEYQSSSSAAPLVVFLALSEPVHHYNRILRKQGCNLVAYQDSGSIVLMDMLSLAGMMEKVICTPVDSGSKSTGVSSKCLLSEVYQNVLENLRKHPGRPAWIIIDDVSVLEVVSQGSNIDLLDFIHYCRALSSSEQSCSLVLLVHQDIYQSSEEVVTLIKHLEHWADTVINVAPLSTGSAIDVHGQMTIIHRTSYNTKCHANLMVFTDPKKELYSLHYKILENTVHFFPPGKHF
eukprot:c6335_g1_i1 orf=320-1147(-)